MAPDGLPMASGPQVAIAEPPRKRRRPALACEECRKRKIKCDRNNPCVHCKASKALVCSYRSNYSSTAPQVQGTAPVTVSGHVIPGQDGNWTGSVSHILPTPGSSPGTAAHSEVPRQRTHSTSTLSVPSGSAADYTIRSLQSQVQNLEQQLSEARKAAHVNPSNEASHQKTDKSIRGVLSKTRLFGPSHWMSVVASTDQFGNLQDTFKSNDLNNSASFQQLLVSKPTSKIWDYLQSCKSVARRLKSHDHTPWLTEAQWKESVPPKEVADKLIGNYLRTFESAYRILHIPTFESEYVQFWENPAAAGTGFVIKMLLVMAIGTSLHQEGDDSLHKIGLQWIYAAQTWLSGPFEKHRLNLTGLQIHCLLILARQTAGIDEALLWMPVGALLRFAMMMGLHRDPRHFPKMSVMQTEMRRRLWSTVLEMALQSALDSGQIPMISLEDFDTQAPSNIDDREVDENTTSLPSKPLSILTQTSMQILLRQSFPIRLQALKLINHVCDEPIYDSILAQHRALEAAFRDSSLLVQGYKASRPILPALTAANSTFPTIPVFTTFHANLLTHFHRRLTLALHRHFAVRARHDPRYYFSRKTCLDHAMSLLYPEPDPDWTALQLIGGGGFREAAQTHAGAVVYLELVNQLNDDVANLAVDRAANRAAREPLVQALREAKETCREQIKRGRTNIKGFAFIAIAIVHAEAVERGVQPERAMLETGREIGREALEMLKKRLGVEEAERVVRERERDGEGVGETVGGEKAGKRDGVDEEDRDRPTCQFTENLMERLERTAKEMEREKESEGEGRMDVGAGGSGSGSGAAVDIPDAAGAQVEEDFDLSAGLTPELGFDFSASWLFSGWDESSWV